MYSTNDKSKKVEFLAPPPPRASSDYSVRLLCLLSVRAKKAVHV